MQRTSGSSSSLGSWSGLGLGLGSGLGLGLGLVHAGRRLGNVLDDAQQLARVASRARNLLVAAARHLGKGGVRVRVKFKRWRRR